LIINTNALNLKLETQDDVTIVSMHFSVLMEHVTCIFQDTTKPACLL